MSRETKRWLVIMLALMMAAPALTACGDDMATGPPERERRSRQAETAPEVSFDDFDDFEEAEDYTRPDYPVRRNPFQPNLDILGGQREREEEEQLRPTEPLEEFAISSLSLVTVISETTVPKAMFVDPTGHGHVAKEGDRIGRNNGVIRAIRHNEVEIREGDDRGSSTIVRLRERELRTAEDRLTEEEQEALQRLLGSTGGREALQRELAGSQEESGQAPPSTRDSQPSDRRFPGLAPPGQD